MKLLKISVIVLLLLILTACNLIASENAAKTPDEVLISFFDALSKEDYLRASAYYDFEGHWESLSYGTSEDAAKRLEEYCDAVGTCLSVEILEMEKSSDDETTFLVQFIDSEGDIYIYGPCCGATEEEMPSTDTFEYVVQKINGVYKVITPPLYRP